MSAEPLPVFPSKTAEPADRAAGPGVAGTPPSWPGSGPPSSGRRRRARRGTSGPDNHLTGTADWAAGAVRTGDGTPAADRDYVAGDYLASYDAAVAAAVDAFGAPGAAEAARPAAVRRVSRRLVLGIAVQDQFVHGWDLARATGQPANLDPGLAEDLLASARAVITDAFRGPEGAALFGPARQPGPGAGAAGGLAAFLGRPA